MPLEKWVWQATSCTCKHQTPTLTTQADSTFSVCGVVCVLVNNVWRNITRQVPEIFTRCFAYGKTHRCFYPPHSNFPAHTIYSHPWSLFSVPPRLLAFIFKKEYRILSEEILLYLWILFPSSRFVGIKAIVTGQFSRTKRSNFGTVCCKKKKEEEM